MGKVGPRVIILYIDPMENKQTPQAANIFAHHQAKKKWLPGIGVY